MFGTLLIKMKQMRAERSPRCSRLFDACLKFFGWKRDLLTVPRSQARWLKLDVRGVPARFLTSALALQLNQLLGAGRYGFCYRVFDDTAHLWYWDESPEGALAAAWGEDAHDAEYAPWPESLLRPALADGVHLLDCLEGCEAVSVTGGRLTKTRWFAAPPDEAQWRAFARDAGFDPERYPLPPVRSLRLGKTPEAGWKLSTRLIRPISPVVWLSAAVVALVGAVVVAFGIYSLKLSWAIASERAAYERITTEHAETIALQKRIDRSGEFLDAFNGVRPSWAQLELMQAVADAGLISESTRIRLTEWEYRGDRLRLQFAVPADNFSLGLFLGVLESLPAFREIRLITDSPPGTVGIQARVAETPPMADAGEAQEKEAQNKTGTTPAAPAAGANAPAAAPKNEATPEERLTEGKAAHGGS